VSERDWQIDRFEEHRTHLQAVAYRMLGSVSEAEDALQEAWVRLSRADSDAVENLGGWLTTVVGRVCLDMLRARRSRREDYVGTWLPEPIVAEGEGGDPAYEAVLADSVGLALFVVLETLTPASGWRSSCTTCSPSRSTRLLRSSTGPPTATRQLASRADGRVQGATPVPDVDLPRQREIVDAFLAASRAGDFEALLEVLDPQVVFRVDAGATSRLARGPITWR